MFWNVRGIVQDIKKCFIRELILVFNAIIEHVGLRELPLSGRYFTLAGNLADLTYKKIR